MNSVNHEAGSKESFSEINNVSSPHGIMQLMQKQSQTTDHKIQQMSVHQNDYNIYDSLPWIKEIQAKQAERPNQPVRVQVRVLRPSRPSFRIVMSSTERTD
jgi:hypothetical protein